MKEENLLFDGAEPEETVPGSWVFVTSLKVELVTTLSIISPAPCSRPLCKCADFGAVEPRNLGDFRSNFNGGEILRASLLLSPRLIFSSK